MKFKLLLLILFISPTLFAQQSRLDALGGLSYSIVDIDSQIDPYILGGNPAWLINSQVNRRLEIDPVFRNSKGDYHRYYESGNINNFDLSFMGIKPLGSSGTFRGYASYNYEMQKDRNKILTLEPYSGDAFFFTDTTSGDYRYSGPTFEFMHSLELIDNFFVGASVSYKILDGLKKVYTFAETLYRKVSGNIGIAYRFSNNFSFGVNYEIYDAQERITATDVNNRTVQTFLYRGDRYKIELRGTSQSYKLKKFGNIFSAQTQFTYLENLTIGLDFKYVLHNSKSLFPASSLIDVEDGYTSYENSKIILQARWLQSNSFTFGFTAGYTDDNSWSKNSKRNLTIWELSVDDIFTGVGLTYSNKSKNILVGTEYELHSIAADSLKYIDNKFSEITAFNHIARVGFEASLSEMFVVRIGYNFIYKEHDFIFGGKNVVTHFITFGGRVKLSNSVEIEPRFEYAATRLSENSLYKNNYGIYTTLRFYNF
ncbi:MAG: hypothetical protein L3J41_04290 [Melioribacteraceae bacterium]|nr:hypothetical protein [Melioribacteraceae bacterium]